MSFNTPQDTPNAASDPLQQVTGWLKKYWKLVVFAVAPIIVIAITVASIISFNNGVNDEGNERQNDLISLNLTMSQQLSVCMDISTVSAQVAYSERKSFEDAMTSIVLAESGNGKPVDIGVNSVAVTTVKRAYPTISNDLYRELMANAVGCRKEFLGRMDHLQFAAGEFKSWTETGGTFARNIRNNFPTDKLTVTVAGEKLTGQAALDFMITPILTNEALEAIETRVMPNQDLSGTGG